MDRNFGAKLGDLGFAHELPRVVSDRTLLTAKYFARTEGYYPPELSEGLYSPKSDMYSYGVAGIMYYSSDNSNYLCIFRLFWRPTVAKEVMSPAVKIIDWYVCGSYVQMQDFITVEYLRVTRYQCFERKYTH